MTTMRASGLLLTCEDVLGKGMHAVWYACSKVSGLLHSMSRLLEKPQDTTCLSAQQPQS